MLNQSRTQAAYLGLHVFVSTSAPLLHLFYTEEFLLTTNHDTFPENIYNEKNAKERTYKS